MISFGIAIIAILWIAIGCLYNSYAVTIQKAKVWHDFDIPNKVAAIRESAKLLSKEDREAFQQTIVDGSIEKFNVGGGILGQLNSLREEVRRYNDAVIEWQETRRRPVWPNWLYIPEKVNELELIRIEPIIQGIIPK